MPELEEIRDRYDRANFADGAGVTLIGLPGIEKRLARYPQVYSRIGFVHHFRPLSEEELRFILAHKWQEIGLTFSPDDYTDAEALAAIAHHRRQLPAGAAPLRPDRTDAGDQPTADDHPGGRRDRPREPGQRAASPCSPTTHSSENQRQ